MQHLPTITDVFNNLEARLRKEKERLEPIPERAFSFPFELPNLVDVDIQFDKDPECNIDEDEIEVIYKGVDVTPIIYAIAEILDSEKGKLDKIPAFRVVSDYLIEKAGELWEEDLRIEKRAYLSIQVYENKNS